MALRHILPVALLCSAAAAQDATIAFPNNYRKVLDNADVTVVRVHYRPHEFVGVHDHSDHPTIYIYLNDSGPVRFVHEPENVVLTRPPTHAGAYRVSPGRRERHTVTNLSDRPSDYLRVELKKIPMRTFKREFREAAPATLVQGTKIEYENPVLRIERVVCNARADCAVVSESAPSVLVALSPAKLANQRTPLTLDEPAAWLPAGTSTKAKSSGPEAVEMLRIVLLAQ